MRLDDGQLKRLSRDPLEVLKHAPLAGKGLFGYGIQENSFLVFLRHALKGQRNQTSQGLSGMKILGREKPVETLADAGPLDDVPTQLASPGGGNRLIEKIQQCIPRPERDRSK